MSNENQYAREQRVNRNLTIVVVAMTAVILGLIFLSYNLSKTITVELLPEINGVATVESGETQLHNVYGLGSLVFLGLNTWETDGEIEYIKNINEYIHFIDDDFKEWLVNDYSYKKKGENINELEGRSKEVKFLDQFYKPEKIRSLGNGSWTVKMELEVKEKIGKLVIKHYTAKFEVYVRKSAPTRKNPWGLKVAGEPIEIERMNTIRG